ncbi:hypothetical protein C7S18_21080 [Ahniella affigens]|uniref:Uncharacterized protein n=1 Tax=Ahniella affigens TaxID=2021234 RepID=A0A2P1PXF3_9GAMM|nr:hypothetical protein [Ahniella affigens]AVP99512.1 hypothetical protein C7S18_21080 [Ahniella affigens]
MPLVFLILLGIAAYALYRVYQPVSKGSESELLRLCLGDDALANRLIRRELELSPEIGRAEAVRRAVIACQRDRR